MRWIVTMQDRWGSSLEMVCPHDRRVVIRHCGHPTALRPWYVILDGVERVNDLGCHRTQGQAQRVALDAWAVEGVELTLTRLERLATAARDGIRDGAEIGPLFAELVREANVAIPMIDRATKAEGR